jgi:hypothetical protein
MHHRNALADLLFPPSENRQPVYFQKVNEKPFAAFGLGGTTRGAAATTAASTLTTASPRLP